MRHTRQQKGFVLIASLLLLIIVTIIAMGMFRSFGVQERIAGNAREKRRALNAALTAMQYAEWWLSNGGNSASAPVVCSAVLNANIGQSQICSNVLSASVANVTQLPWTIGGASVGVTYLSPNMTVVAGGSAGTYTSSPIYYISYLGPSADGTGNAFRIDAAGYGGNSAAIAVVESTVEVSSGIVNRGGL